jgi:hypothetical protein
LSTRQPSQDAFSLVRCFRMARPMEHLWPTTRRARLSSRSLLCPEAPSFHLKATIVETTSPTSGTKAAIEEHWIEVATHSAIPELLTDHDRRRRQDCRAERRGLFPWWLNDLTAIFDPLPTLDQLKQMKAQWTHLTSQRISSNLFSRRELRPRVPN